LKKRHDNLLGCFIINFLENTNMKKSLLVVALMGTFGAAGVATAQTSVTMYGTVDAGVAYQRGVDNSTGGSGGKTFSLESGQQSYSRIGFRGVEDLGSGLKALFVLEQGVQIDTGDSGYQTLGSQINTPDVFTGNSNTGTFNSQAFVGLSSNVAGTVSLGRQFSPLYEAYGDIDPFKNGFAANINNFFGTVGNDSPYQRMNNAIIYHTPENLYGFKGALAYGFGEVPGSTGSEAQYGLNVGYANGPFEIIYAFHHADNDALGLDAFRTHFVGATVDFNILKLHAAVDQNKINAGPLNAEFKQQDYMIGVTVPFGSNTIFADYTYKKDKVADSANASQFALGYTYALSKRTNLYTAYTHVRNDTFSNVDTDLAGTNVNIFQVGLRHKF
jgi:predicted porin